MSRSFALIVKVGSLALALGSACAVEEVSEDRIEDTSHEAAEAPPAARVAALAAVTSTPATCGIGGEVLASRVLTAADIPSLSALERTQIILALQESAHTDVTTIEEAFQRTDGHEINSLVVRNQTYNQFYVEIEYGAGDNSYGAYFYWGTSAMAAAIHDGDQYECGGVVYDYDRGDTAAACAGLLTYVNGAPFAALDAYLPSNVAQNLVSARAVHPFDSVASIVAVNGVAEVRLQQLVTAARINSDLGPTCSGVYDQIATSRDEASAIVAFLNEASREELRGVLAYLINEAVVDNLRARRPFASAAAVAETVGVGPAVFRTLRNAATRYRPYEQLVDAVNASTRPYFEVRIDRHFEWLPLVSGAQGFRYMSCFGIAPALLPQGAVDRPTLAGGNEVVENFAEAVALADWQGTTLPIDPHPAYGDLEHRTLNRSFFGCYIGYQPDPWTYDRQTFYVDTATGESLLITSHFEQE